ncbi:IS200/IS605 family transposase [Nonomuraea sp. 3-1Str]|uniref:IS200/IS605 family transposase n=1 Tax=Nonomuraea sp. 3-1Str TaxID=2929801 RepID=UPI002866EA9E|nr:IS200/IS605 family transposase [Nonomuraea sp. 3-1Str]MDR8410235.1 IS200/IS605 family transposase [Nonomuraea sp. 3-1Str]
MAYDVGFHVVWCPNCHRRVLGGRAKDRLEESTRARPAGHGWKITGLGVTPDCVRLLVKAHPKVSTPYGANQFEGHTSHVLHEEFPHLRSRLLTLRSRSCFVASVGAVSAATVRRYIETQGERVPKKEGGDA